MKKYIFCLLLAILFLTSCSSNTNLDQTIDNYKENYSFKVNSNYKVSISSESIHSKDDTLFNEKYSYNIEGLVTGVDSSSYNHHNLLFTKFNLEHNAITRESALKELIIVNSNYVYKKEEKIENQETKKNELYCYEFIGLNKFVLPTFLILGDKIGYFKFFENNELYNTKYNKNNNTLTLSYEILLYKVKTKDNNIYGELVDDFPCLSDEAFPNNYNIDDGLQLGVKFEQTIILDNEYIDQLNTRVIYYDYKTNKILTNITSNIQHVSNYNDNINIDFSNCIYDNFTIYDKPLDLLISIKNPDYLF